MKVNGTVRRDAVALVVWQYDGGGHRRGDIVSQHRTMDAAQRAAGKSSFWGVVDVRDIE